MSQQATAPAHPAPAADQVPQQMLDWFVAQCRAGLLRMFTRQAQAHVVEFDGRNPQTGQTERYVLVLSIMPEKQLDLMQKALANQLGGKK